MQHWGARMPTGELRIPEQPCGPTGDLPELRCCPRGGESPGVARLLEIQRLDRKEEGASRDRERQVSVEMRLRAGKVKNIRKYYCSTLVNRRPHGHLRLVVNAGIGPRPVIKNARAGQERDFSAALDLNKLIRRAPWPARRRSTRNSPPST